MLSRRWQGECEPGRKTSVDAWKTTGDVCGVGSRRESKKIFSAAAVMALRIGRASSPFNPNLFLRRITRLLLKVSGFIQSDELAVSTQVNFCVNRNR